MKRRQESPEADLFAVSNVSGGDGALIRSSLVEETKDWLSARALTLGNMLASERAVEYVAILRALAAFRDEHEPEPLHEDVELKVCGEDTDPSAAPAFKSDIRQLKEWGLVTERIEKERLRGYRDNRRTKFRYRICDDAAAFVEWLAERHAHDLAPGGGDETGNLLDMQRSLAAELRRMLHRVDAAAVNYETAGDILFRADQMRRSRLLANWPYFWSASDAGSARCARRFCAMWRRCAVNVMSRGGTHAQLRSRLRRHAFGILRLSRSQMRSVSLRMRPSSTARAGRSSRSCLA